MWQYPLLWNEKCQRKGVAGLCHLFSKDSKSFLKSLQFSGPSPQPLKILFFVLCPTCTAIQFCNFVQTNKLWSWGSKFSMILLWFTLQKRSGITIKLNVKGFVQIFWLFKQSITFALFFLQVPFLSFIIMGLCAMYFWCWPADFHQNCLHYQYFSKLKRLLDGNCALIRRRSRWPENMMNGKANNKNPDIVTNCILCFIFVAQQLGELGESIVRSSKDLKQVHLTDCGGCRAGQIWAQLTWEVGTVRRTWPEPAALPHTALQSGET